MQNSGSAPVTLAFQEHIQLFRALQKAGKVTANLILGEQCYSEFMGYNRKKNLES